MSNVTISAKMATLAMVKIDTMIDMRSTELAKHKKRGEYSSAAVKAQYIVELCQVAHALRAELDKGAK